MKRRASSLLLACLWVTGCATVPFPAPEPFPPGESAPEDVPARFEARLAPRYEQVSALVFRVFMRDFPALGYAAVDVPARTFSLACLNPLGIKIFELVGDQGQVAARFVAPEIQQHGGKLAQAAGQDLMHAFFDWSPPAGTPGRLRKGRLVFCAEDATGRTEYGYAGPDGRLAEKTRYEGRRRLWRVAYRGYREEESGWVPSAIVVWNWQYRYRLMAAGKESAGP